MNVELVFLLSKPEVALVEYIGEYVDPTLPHGNVKEVKNLPVVAPPYLRTHKHILESIQEAMKETAETVFQNLISEYEIARVRNKKQNVKRLRKVRKDLFLEHVLKLLWTKFKK